MANLGRVFQGVEYPSRREACQARHREYVRALADGLNFTQAAHAVGVSKRTGKVWRNGRTRSSGRGVAGLGGAGARPPAGLIRSPAVLGLTVGLGDPWAYCRGVVVLGCAAGAWVSVGLLLGSVSTERNMSRYVRPARRSRWGSVHGAQLIRPTRPGWLWRGVDGPCQFRVCSCVLGRCTRSVGNAPLLFGCSAPYRV